MNSQEKRELASKLIIDVVRGRLAEVKDGLPEGMFSNAYALNDKFKAALGEAEDRAALRSPEENLAVFDEAFDAAVNQVSGMYLGQPGYGEMNANMAVNGMNGKALGDLFAMVNGKKSNVVELKPASSPSADKVSGPTFPGAARG